MCYARPYMLYYAKLQWAKFFYNMFFYAWSYFAMLCYASLDQNMLCTRLCRFCETVLGYMKLYLVMIWHIILRHTTLGNTKFIPNWVVSRVIHIHYTSVCQTTNCSNYTVMIGNTILCYGMIYYAKLLHIMKDIVSLTQFVLCYVRLCVVILCYACICSAILRNKILDILHNAIPCWV